MSRHLTTWAMILIAVVVGGTLATWGTGATSGPPADLDPQASQVLAPLAQAVAAARHGGQPADWRVLAAATARYPLLGRSVLAHKVLNRRTAQYVRVSLDAGGQAVDPEALEAAEQAAHAARYGRLEPALAERLAGAAPDERIPVMIWLREPAGAPAAGPEAAPEPPRSPVQWAAAVAPVVAPVAEHLRLQGHPVATATYLPLVYAALTPATIRVVAAWPEVDRIYLDRVVDPAPDAGRPAPADLVEPQLNIAAKAIRADKVWARGITGSSRFSRVAVLEALGGRAAPNPYLGVVTQDPFYVCLQPNDHTMAVAGVVRSKHPIYRGIAPGAPLWVGGSCRGLFPELINRAERALNVADVLNVSFALATHGEVDGLARAFDELAYRFGQFGKIIVASAGNIRKTGFFVTSPALGYNILAVGMVDDRGTADRTKHQFDGEESPGLPPVSRHNDRNKPEVIAPGVKITTLSHVPPWISSGQTGTSLSAPMVAGAAALMKHRDLGIGPEQVRATLMATASWRIMFGLERGVGAGEIEAARADDLLGGAGPGNEDWFRSTTLVGYNWCAPTFRLGVGSFYPWTRSPNVAKRLRAAIAWLEKTTPPYPGQPGADLDLFLYQGEAGSSEPPRLLKFTTPYDPPEKLLSYRFPPCPDPATCGRQVVTLIVKPSRCDRSPSQIGVAWRVSKDWDWDPAN